MKTRICVLILFLLFFIAPLQSQNTPFPFVAIGDTGCGCTGQRLVAQRMFSWSQKYPYYAVIMMGDNIYPGRAERGGSRYLFDDRFDEMYKPLLIQGVKFYAVLGNHDLEANGGADEIADKSRFHIADAGYYSFHTNQQVDGRPLLEFFAINSNRLLTLHNDPAQINWLSKALSDSKAIWKIAYFHHPIYAPEGPHPAAKSFRHGIEKILMAAGVQLTLSGHDHYYARMKPQNGILHMITGGGGMDLKTPRPTEETEKAMKAFHFVYFEVFPDHLEYWAVPTSGVPFDHGTLSVGNVLPPAQTK